jgi:hypothetical protein
VKEPGPRICGRRASRKGRDIQSIPAFKSNVRRRNGGVAQDPGKSKKPVGNDEYIHRGDVVRRVGVEIFKYDRLGTVGFWDVVPASRNIEYV